MRLNILLCILLLSTTNFTFAQDVRFGLKGGINFSNASEGDSKNQSITSFLVGGVMEALYDDKIALQPEIIYSEQGFTYYEDTQKRELKLSYINVPIMVKYYLINNMTLEAGPQIGFLSTAKLMTTNNDVTDTRNIKEGLRSNDLSVNLGFGFQLKNGLNLNARYSYGVTNIVNRLSDEKFKNRVVQVSIGYMFKN